MWHKAESVLTSLQQDHVLLELRSDVQAENDEEEEGQRAVKLTYAIHPNYPVEDYFAGAP